MPGVVVRDEIVADVAEQPPFEPGWFSHEADGAVRQLPGPPMFKGKRFLTRPTNRTA